MTVLEELPARVTALESQVSQLRDEMRSEFSSIRTEMQAGNQALGEKIDEVMSHARALNEDVIARIKIMGEGNAWRHRPPRKRR